MPVNFARVFNHEIDILSSVCVGKNSSRPFGNLQEHGNEADWEQLFNAWASFALTFLYFYDYDNDYDYD